MYQLTNQQQQMINIESVFTGSSINTLGAILEFVEPYSYDMLNKACNKMIASCDSFQIRYKQHNGEIVQVFEGYQFEDLPFYDFNQDSEAYKNYVSEKMDKCYFGLESKLYEINLLVHPNGNPGFALFVHHSISDAWSMSEIISNALFKVLRNENLEIGSFEELLKEVEGNKVVSKRFSKNKEYWEAKLDKFEGVSEYPNLKPDTNLASERFSQVLSDDLSRQLQLAASETGVSVPALILSACAVVRAYQSFSEDVCIGVSLLGRGKNEKQIMGDFVKVMPLLLSVDGNMKISDLCSTIKKEEFSLFKHQEYYYSDIKQYMTSELKKDINLLEFCFSYQNARLNNELTDMCHSIKWENSTNQNIPLTLHVSDRESRGSIEFDYDFVKAIIPREYIERFHSRLLNVMLQIVDGLLVADKTVADINIITDDEEMQILNEFNNNEISYPQGISVIEILEEQVEKYPERIALDYEGKKLTYRELNNKANRLAHKLRKMGVQPEDKIAILAERSPETIVGIYGVLKSGGAYVPIDSGYPESRVQFLLEDCNPKALLITRENELRTDIPVLNLHHDSSYDSSEENPIQINQANDLAYIIYTSGTTGQPKGVMIEHKDIIALVINSDYTILDENTVILQTGSIAFDASTFEIWGTSLNGGRLCLVDEETLLDATKIENIISQQEINTVFITTALFNQMISQDPTVFNGLSHILFGGEQTSERHVDMLMKAKSSRLTVSNIYGPTENTTFAATYLIPEENRREKTPIGKPIANTLMYIMNGDQLCGIGMPGELCIAGAGVARGYLNRPELTKEKFVENPFGEGQMYRTGDLTRWIEGGNIEYLGRLDAQVKIRGFRIELNEIENIIRKQQEIKDVVVIAKTREEGEKYLCAYVVWEKGQTGNVEGVRQKIRQELPEYMVPAYWAELDELPITKNGKLNKAALPDIEMVSNVEYIPPATAEEIAAAEVFREVLGVDRVGVSDNFFELGGDSIKAIRVCSKMREKGYELNIRDVMAYQTIRKLYEGNCINISDTIQDQREVSGSGMLSPIQEMFFSQGLKEQSHFNQALMLESDTKLQRNVLEKVLEALVVHHDMLRAVYIDGQQYIRRVEECEPLYNLYEFDLGGLKEEEIYSTIYEESTNIQKSMDIKKGSLVKCGLFKTEQKDYIMLSIHHLVVDGVSWRIIVEDLKEGYSQYLRDEQIKMPLKSMSYLNWTEKLYDYSNSYVLSEERNFWKQLCDKANLVDTTLQYVSTGDVGYGQCIYTFPNTSYNSMLASYNSIYNAQANDLLLTALCMAMREWGDRDLVAVELEGHGRENLHEAIDINRTVGWFTSKYPVVFDTYDHIHGMLIEVRAKLLRIPNHGVGFGVLKYINKDEDLNTNIDLCFNYLGEVENLSRNEGIMKYSSLSCGKSVSSENKPFNIITIDAILLKDELVITLTYDQAQITENRVNLLGQAYINALKELQEFSNSYHMPLEEVVITQEVCDDDFTEEEVDVLNDLLEFLDFD